MAYAVARKALASHHGWLDIPIEMYLDKDDYGYELHYVPILDKDGKPTGEYQLNPFHTHFIHPAIETVTADKIKKQIDFHLPNFYEAWKSGKTIRSGWDTNTRKAPTRYDREMTKEQFAIRQRLVLQKVKEFAVVSKSVELTGGKTFPATTIDVGAGATNRASSQGSGYMALDLTNRANDAGELDTFEAWFSSNGSSVKLGTFYGSAPNFTDRDYFTWGSIASGSKQTSTGQSVDVSTDDLIGGYWSSGYIERDSSGYSGVPICSSPGDFFGAGSKTYNTLPGDAISLYATGDTGGWSNIAKINGIAAGDIAKVNGIAVTNIAKINGVAV